MESLSPHCTTWGDAEAAVGLSVTYTLSYRRIRNNTRWPDVTCNLQVPVKVEVKTELIFAWLPTNGQFLTNKNVVWWWLDGVTLDIHCKVNVQVLTSKIQRKIFEMASLQNSGFLAPVVQTDAFWWNFGYPFTAIQNLWLWREMSLDLRIVQYKCDW